MSRPWIAVGLVLTMASASRADDGAIAARAQAVLKTYCHKCHGENGRVEGGFNTVIDLAKLVADEKVKPKEPDESEIYQRMTDAAAPMPPKKDKADRSANPAPLPRPSEDEVAAVRAWIEAGAPPVVEIAAKPRTFLGDDEATALMLADLEKLDVRSRHYIRYFTITHLYNAGLNDDQLATYRVALSKLINSLSWGRRIKKPVAVDPAKTILRIDLRDYNWNEFTWRSVLAQYPYGVIRESKSAKSLYAGTACELPYVRADWFVFAASKPPLYHDVLGIPKSDSTLERKLDVDVAADIREERKIARAGFNKSGVSVNNRMIERHESSYGSYWKSYDFGGNDPDKGQLLFQRPLGPGTGALAFRHDGGEIIFSLPNGLQAYMLTKSDGTRLDEGPLNIVKDPNQAGAAVINGISCMNCHYSGMLRKSDQIRPLADRGVFAEADADKIKALYPPKATFDALLKEDEDRFARAVEETGAAVTPSEPISLLARQFETELDLPLAAAESGFQVGEFQKLIAGSSRLAGRLGLLLVPGGSVKRDAFVATFPLIVADGHLGKLLPRAVAADVPGAVRPAPAAARPAIVGDPFEGRTAGEEKQLRVGSVDFSLSWCPPTKKFRMGSPLSEAGRVFNEAPVDVALSKGFWVMRTEMTQELYEAIMGLASGTSPAEFRGMKMPVDRVAYTDAVECAQAATRKLREARQLPEGWELRLPTEAQWEYMARAGTTTAFPWGDSLHSGQANFDDDSPSGGAAKGDYLRKTRNVARYEPNAWKIYDTAGNIMEWALDNYEDELPGGTDPFVTGAKASNRVARGGCWAEHARGCRSAVRFPHSPDYRGNTLGFRLAVVRSKP